jgi:dolichol-phosphate mannosyltransferase
VLTSITSDYEIIYVNDASPDNAETVLREFAARDPKLTVISHSRNFGSQNAFTSGMAQSMGDAVILMDGDLQDPPEVIPELVEKWLQGYDVVYGVRVKREDTAFRRIAYKIFYRLFRFLSYIDVPLDAGDFSLMDRRVVELLVEMPERDRFLRGMRAWLGFRQTGITYQRAQRYAGESTNTLFDNIRWALLGIFSFSYFPLELTTFVAFFMMMISLLALAIYLTLYFVSPTRPPSGIMTLVVLILFLSSVQLLSLSVIAQYLARIFVEAKGRPRYVVKEIINDHRAAHMDLKPTEAEK